MPGPDSGGSLESCGMKGSAPQSPMRAYAATQMAEDAKGAKRFHLSTAVTLVR